MDNNKIFTTAREREHNLLKTALIDQFKEFNHKKRPFIAAFNSITTGLQEKEKSLELQINNIHPGAFELFNKSFHLYEGQENEKIENVLKNEVSAFFQKDDKLDKYPEFIQTISEQKCIADNCRHLRNNSNYFEHVYKLGKYDYFYLIDEKRNLENSDEFVEMNKKLFPNNYSTTNQEEIVAITPQEPKSKEEIKYSEIIKTITAHERKFMLHVLFELTKPSEDKELEIPLTDFLKILVITRQTCDLELFVKAPNFCGYYNEIRKGTKSIKRAEKSIFLSQLGDKLDKLQLNTFANIIRYYQSVN